MQKKTNREKTLAVVKENAILLERYKKVFSGVAGQEVLKDLMERFSFLKSSYNGNLNDTVYNEGSRAVVLFIMSQLETDIGRVRKYITDLSSNKVEVSGGDIYEI